MIAHVKGSYKKIDASIYITGKILTRPKLTYEEIFFQFQLAI